jgi:hypothetical protein
MRAFSFLNKNQYQLIQNKKPVPRQTQETDQASEFI